MAAEQFQYETAAFGADLIVYSPPITEEQFRTLAPDELGSRTTLRRLSFDSGLTVFDSGQTGLAEPLIIEFAGETSKGYAMMGDGNSIEFGTKNPEAVLRDSETGDVVGLWLPHTIPGEPPARPAERSHIWPSRRGDLLSRLLRKLSAA